MEAIEFDAGRLSTSTSRRNLIVALGGAVLTSVLARTMAPTERLADRLGKLDLDLEVPRQFDGWTIEFLGATGIVDPEQEQLMKLLYSQVLNRNYIHDDGYRIMLSIAYGGDRRTALQTHYPEVCYPGQGFDIRRNATEDLVLPLGTVPVRRLDTARGRSRLEPVTYWAMVGDQPELAGYQRRIGEIKFALRGLIPDGLLFRVSSIDADADSAFARHDQFIAALLSNTRPEARKRLSGL